MSDDAVRVWLVKRDYDDRDLITLVYATPEGDRMIRKEQAASTIARGSGVTAARDVATDRLEEVPTDDLKERYAAEAVRVSENHDPDEAI